MNENLILKELLHVTADAICDAGIDITPDELSLNDDLRNLYFFDSLDIISLCMSIEKHFDIQIPFGEEFNHNTIEDWYNEVIKQLNMRSNING